MSPWLAAWAMAAICASVGPTGAAGVAGPASMASWYPCFAEDAACRAASAAVVAALPAPWAAPPAVSLAAPAPAAPAPRCGRVRFGHQAGVREVGVGCREPPLRDDGLDDRAVGAAPLADDGRFDLTLRARNFAEVGGQRALIDNLRVFVKAAAARK